MKTKLAFLFFIFIGTCSFAQDGKSCNSAIELIPGPACNYQAYATSETEMWFYFVAQSSALNLSLVTYPYTDDLPHIHQLSLLNGVCSENVILATERLPISDAGEDLTINLNAGKLNIGTTYLVKVERIPSADNCDKPNCYGNNYASPATFQLCLQNINAATPPDVNLEEPMPEHEYIANEGQLTDESGNPLPDVKFYTQTVNPNIYIGNSNSSLRFLTYEEESNDFQEVTMTLNNAIVPYQVLKADKSPNLYNFFLPAANGELNGVKAYYMIVCYNVYPDIDLIYYSNEAGLKLYYVIRPGANPGNISMTFSGANSIHVDDDGGLEIFSDFGVMHFETGHPFQISGDDEPLPLSWNASFTQSPTDEIGLSISTYDATRALIIQLDQGHRSGLTPINPQCELQVAESDGFDDPNLDMTNKWGQDGFGAGQAPNLWAKISPGCNNEDQDPDLNSYSGNSNLVHGTAVIGNQAENILRLNTKYEPLTRRTDIWDCNSSPAPFTYTTAILKSQQNFKYGFFEMKAKLPGGSVNHSPAFWLWGVNNNRYSEIDMYEFAPCYPSDNKMLMSLHNWPSGNGGCLNCYASPNNCNCGYLYNNPCSGSATVCGQGGICPSSGYTIPGDPRANYHTYGVDWQPGIIKFYLDGNLIKSYDHLQLSDNPNYDCHNSDFPYTGGSTWCQFSPTKNLLTMDAMHLVVWNRLGSQGPLPQTGNDYYFDIDYVKVCKVKPSISAPHSICTSNTYTFTAYQYGGYTTVDYYTWNVTGGYVSSYLNSSHSQVQIMVTDLTTLTVTVTATENTSNAPWISTNLPARQSSITRTYSLEVPPPTPFLILSQRWGSLCQYRFYVVAAPNADAYYWSKDNGATWHLGEMSGGLNYFNTAHIEPNGNYNIRVFAANCTGVSGVRYQTVHTGPYVNGCIDHHRMDNDTLQSENDNFVIYPNPSHDSFTLKLDETKVSNLFIRITDVLGREVTRISKQETEDSEITFGNELRPGIYMVSVTLDNNVENIKIVKTER